MFFEMAGMVGAGKSTCANVLRTILSENNFRVLSREEAVGLCMERSLPGRIACGFLPAIWRKSILNRLYRYGFDRFHRLSFVLRHPALFLHVCGSQLHSNLPWWHKKIVLGLFFEIVGAYGFLRRRLRADEIVILEEGLIHRAVNLYAWRTGPLEAHTLITYFRHLPVHGVVVLVKAPFAICLERARMRGFPGRLVSSDGQTIDRFMSNSYRIVDVACEFLMEAKQQLIVVDNGGKLQDGANRLMDSLRASGILTLSADNPVSTNHALGL